MTVLNSLDSMFRPASIAVVGAARDKPGGSWVDIFGRIVEFGYSGHLYPINPNADTIRGHRAYPDLASVPEPVDLVIIALSAGAVPAILNQCAATGNRNVHIFSGGFGETGEASGEALQDEIEQIAAANGLRVIGPNSMGFFSPAQRLVTWGGAPEEAGSVGILTQSGGFADAIVGYGTQLGLAFSTVINYGSGLTLDATSLLEFLAADPDTKIIGIYLEGVADGRALLEAAAATNPEKPILIVKAGASEAAKRAAASHTGSLAGDDRIWQAFFAQTGAMRVGSVQEMAHTMVALQRLPAPGGPRVAVIGTGGGSSVAAADVLSQFGLEVPPISSDGLEALRSIIPAAGNIITNPIDAHDALNDPELMAPLLDAVSAEPNIDSIIAYFHIDWMFDVAPDRVHALASFLANDAHRHLNGKPLVATWRSFRSGDEIAAVVGDMQRVLAEGGVPLYPDIDATARALAHAARYARFRAELDDEGARIL